MGRIITKEPPAKTLITGIRAIGYNFSTAVADIIDNSISAKSSRIDVITDVAAGKSYVAFLDNGYGMSYEKLENAMLLGSNRDDRPDSDIELGRFGLGLKSASLSQCREFTVVSKVHGAVNAIMFDLDLIEAENKWNLRVLEEKEIQSVPTVDKLFEYTSGTLVIWTKFDKIESRAKNYEDSFREAVAEAKRHVELVFHRFYVTHEIYFNTRRIEKRDPFLCSSAPRQQTGHTEHLVIGGHTIHVTPHTLPFWNTITGEEKALLGYPKSIYDDQGFYLYRNRRLISWGSWLRMGLKSEQNKLARVQVDIPSSLDIIWMLDVKKSSAKIPDVLKEELRASVRDSFVRSKKTVRFPGIKEQQAENKVWIRTVNMHDKTVQYTVNRDNPLVTELFENLGKGESRLLEMLLSQIETLLPKYSIMNDHTDSLKIHDGEDAADNEQLITELIDILAMAKQDDKATLLGRLIASEAYSCLSDKLDYVTRRVLG
ncbi:ATP-binding protein [Deltaproteobacteria bacterium Smac51]|nr:ATP-binding protein [Deltaproteobacteria bacterium Smac51]